MLELVHLTGATQILHLKRKNQIGYVEYWNAGCGESRSLGPEEGTLILHKKYGVCTGGGFDRKKQTISLHDYWTNKRLTQGAKIEAGRTDALGWHGAPGWSLTTENGRGRARGATHPKPQSKERLLPPTA